MIIRRRHTANFTTIGNVLFEDERLALDEVGLMSWLLSRPNDWQVRRPALMRRFNVGRDGLRRILRALIRYGWVRAKITHLPGTGRVHVLYEVRDEPGPELSEDEARAALSLVSSGAAPGEPVDDDGPEDGTEVAGEGQPDADPGGGSPPTGQPEAASRLRQSPPGYREESLKTDSQRTESTNGARAFQDVKLKWKAEHILSTVTSQAAFEDLNDTDKEACFRGIGPYLADCAANGRKICDLRTFIVERRWERFANSGGAAGGLYHVRPRTPHAVRWREYLERAESQKLRMFDLMMQRNGITMPSEWPPPLPPKSSTGPPDHNLSNEDAKAFIEGK